MPLRLILFVLIALPLCQCSILPSSQLTIKKYVLGDLDCPQNSKHQNTAATLFLAKTSANQYIDSHRIIYSEEKDTRSSYQLSNWVEPVPARFNALLLRKLECVKIFQSVSSRASSVPTHYSLNTEILELQHDLSSAPAQVQILIRAELVDASAGKIAASNVFSYEAAPHQAGPQAAIKELSRGTLLLIDQIIEWLAENLSVNHHREEKFKARDADLKETPANSPEGVGTLH